ncbi:MAG: DMT family transporter [Patescibacteria group bacterium]
MRETFEKYQILFLVIIMSILGANGTFFKIALRELPIDLFTFLRFAFAYIFFLPYLLTQTKEVVAGKRKLILISLLGTLNVFLFVLGLDHTTASIAVTMYASGPLVIAAFSLVILKEKISLKKWLGIFLGFIGVLFIVAAPLFGKGSVWNGTLAGNLTLVGAVLVFSLYSVLSRKYSREYSPLTLTKYFIYTTIVSQTLLLSFHSGSLSLLKEISLTTWLCVIYVAVGGTVLYYILYQYIIKKATAVMASMSFFLQPIAGIIWASLLLGEKITRPFFFGGLLVFLGMAVFFHEQYSSRPRAIN